MVRVGTVVIRGVFISLLMLVAGCATSEEWTIWRGHPTHFASRGHFGFSLRNREGTAPRVRLDDVGQASIESWWGKPITMSQEQILER